MEMWNVCYIDINFSRPVSPDKTCAEDCDWVEVEEIFAFSLIIILVFIEMWIISWAQAHTAAASLRCFNVSCCVYAARSLMLLEVRKLNILLFAFPFHTLFTAARCLALQHKLNSTAHHQHTAAEQHLDLKTLYSDIQNKTPKNLSPLSYTFCSAHIHITYPMLVTEFSRVRRRKSYYMLPSLFIGQVWLYCRTFPLYIFLR